MNHAAPLDDFARWCYSGDTSEITPISTTSLKLSDDALPDLSCGQSSLAHVRAIVLRKDASGMPAYHLLVSREYGESVWESILHAGTEFNLTPFGLQAQQLLKV